MADVRRYCAYQSTKGWTVARILSFGDIVSFKPLGDCRYFESFDLADEAARFVAGGKSNYAKGVYINMR